MTKLTDRVARMEMKAFSPPLIQACIVAANPDGSDPARPAGFGPDDLIIVLVGVEPNRGRIQ